MSKIETNAFERAGTALGKVEGLVVAGNQIIEAINGAESSLAKSKEQLIETLTEIQKARGEIIQTSLSINDAEKLIANTRKDCVKLVEKNVNVAMDNTIEQVETIIAKQEESIKNAKSICKDSLKASESNIQLALENIRDLGTSIRAKQDESIATTRSEVQLILNESRELARKIRQELIFGSLFIVILLVTLFALIFFKM